MPEFQRIAESAQEYTRLVMMPGGMVEIQTLKVVEQIILNPDETQRLREALNPFHALDDLPVRHCPLCGFSGCVCGAADIQAEARAELRALRGIREVKHE